MKTSKKQSAISEKTWAKIHAAYTTRPAVDWHDWPTLKALAARHRVPLFEVECRAEQEDWELERKALRSRHFLDTYAAGIKSENEYVLKYALSALNGLDGGQFPVGGEGMIIGLMAQARRTWRTHMTPVLLWDAIQASRAGQRARTPHGRAERVA